MNTYKKLVWCTERRPAVIAFWLAFAVVIVIVGRLIREAWKRLSRLIVRSMTGRSR
jgi:hypothetical protein